jgi:hypothetical protein
MEEDWKPAVARVKKESTYRHGAD